MKIVVDEISMSLGQDILQNSIVDEGSWGAILVSENNGSTPEFKFPWLWVGLGTAAAVGIVMATQKKD